MTIENCQDLYCGQVCLGSRMEIQDTLSFLSEALLTPVSIVNNYFQRRSVVPKVFSYSLALIIGWFAFKNWYGALPTFSFNLLLIEASNRAGYNSFINHVQGRYIWLLSLYAVGNKRHELPLQNQFPDRVIRIEHKGEVRYIDYYQNYTGSQDYMDEGGVLHGGADNSIKPIEYESFSIEKIKQAFIEAAEQHKERSDIFVEELSSLAAWDACLSPDDKETKKEIEERRDELMRSYHSK